MRDCQRLLKRNGGIEVNMDIIRKKNMRNKIIFVGFVLFAPLLAIQLVILWLLSNDIIGVLVEIGRAHV